VTVTELDGTTIYLPVLEVPEEAVGSFAFHPVLPTGAVAAAMYDDETGLPVGQDALWQAKAVDITTGQVLLWKKSGRGESLKMAGLPEGKFRLLVWVNGYFGYESEPFYLTPGESLRLNPIRLVKHD
jgi:hypothetical protein